MIETVRDGGNRVTDKAVDLPPFEVEPDLEPGVDEVGEAVGRIVRRVTGQVERLTIDCHAVSEAEGERALDIHAWGLLRGTGMRPGTKRAGRPPAARPDC